MILFGLACIPVKSQPLADDCSNLKNWWFTSNVFRITYDSLSYSKSCSILYPKKTNWLWNKNNRPELFTLEGCTLLPKDSIDIFLSLKGSHLDSLILKLFLYSADENLQDSLMYVLDADGVNSISFNNDRAEFMQMQLYGSSLRKNDTVSLQIQSLRILARNHDLKQWAQTPTDSIDIRSITPLPLINHLDEFRSRKIIGLGESFHGGKHLQSGIIDVIRHLLYHDVRLVCFEVPVDMGMNWDLYVQGILPREYRYRIQEELKSTAGDARPFVELLDEIRALNISRKDREKIHVAGLDLRDDLFYLFEYFKAYKDLSRDKKFLVQFMLEDLERMIYHRNYALEMFDRERGVTVDRRHSTKVDRIKAEKKLQKLMKDSDYRFLLETLTLNIPTGKDAREDNGQIYAVRDSIMWNILEAAIACYAPGKKDRVVVYAHNMHLSRTNSEHSLFHLLSKKNLGCYIAERYGTDFWTTSFHAGSGFRKAGELGRVVELPLQKAIPGSFESVADKTGLSDFYCRGGDLGNIFIFRMIANSLADLHFFPLSRSRFDGYAFINITKACSTDQFDHRTSVERNGYMSRYCDSLRIGLAAGSKIFDQDIAPAAVAVPRKFKWKTVSMVNPGRGGQTHGFFESDDRECVVTFGVILHGPKVKTSSPRESNPDLYSGDILELAKADLLYEMGMEGGNSRIRTDNMLRRIGLESGNKLTYSNFDMVMEKLIHVWYSDDAQKIFNADKVIEYTCERNWSPDGYFSKYRYRETISAERNGRVVVLYCLYTDRGYKNREKYRKSIETIFKFK